MLVLRTVKNSSSIAIARQRACCYTCTRVCIRARPSRWAYNAVKSESAAPELDRHDSKLKLGVGAASGVQKALECKLSRSNSPNVKVLDCLPVTSYTGLLSSSGKARNPGGLNTVLESYSGQPADDRIPLHGGLPHPDAFPISQLSVKLKCGASLSIDNVDLVTDAQQYATHLLGLPQLQEWTQEHVSLQHDPPGPFQVLVSNGSNHAIEMVTDLLLERGDSILVEEYTYFYMVDSVLPVKGYHAVPLKMDNQGICPNNLRKVLAERAVSGQVPRVLYTVPTGHNPTGIVTPLGRKREVYSVCQEYGITIIEDDAYYYLQYPCLQGAVPGLQQLVPSYLSIDTDSRVVRLDSWSKVLAPGLRLGWVTGHPDVVDLMALALHASLNGPPGISQALMIAVTQHWGANGFREHCIHMQQVYQHRANVMHTAAAKALAHLAEWQRPQAGMFIWLKLSGVEDIDEVASELVQANVMVLPGKLAHCHGATAAYPCPFIRLSFANASEAQIADGMQRLGNVLRKHEQIGLDELTNVP
ncbi:hypothetical protein WJX79_010292 [Trebouxia sp. C0005]